MICKILRNAKGLEWLKTETGIDPSGYLYATYFADYGLRVVELFRDNSKDCIPTTFELPPLECTEAELAV